jgi:uncharacterized membrane-anchored protein
VVYVPIAVGIGYYGLGYGLGRYLERLRALGADLEGLVLLAALVGFAAILTWRIVRASRRDGGGAGPPPPTSAPDGRGI